MAPATAIQPKHAVILEFEMVKITAGDLRRIMDKKENIRNMSVVGHLHHGKSMLKDSLVEAAGIVSQEVDCDVHMPDMPADAEHNITIKSTAISLLCQVADESLSRHKRDRDGNKYLINLIDTPGHLEFSSEVTAALRITDGALVVVDCIEGVCAQTESVLKQALCERIRPVLTVNKIDKCFCDPKVTGEQIYQTFSQIVDKTNATIGTCKDNFFGEIQVSPDKGNVAFSSGLHGWGFTLAGLAKKYATKPGFDEYKMLQWMWGDNFFDPVTKKWSKMHTGSTTCQRGFVILCYDPIKRIINACMNDDKKTLWSLLQKIGVTEKNDGNDLMGEALMKYVMQTWLPASHALLEISVCHLPSPSEAQKYRLEKLYRGPLNDKYANAIRNCDPGGPLMLYVSKMIPASDKGNFFAFGRVFSGRVSTGMKVRILGPNYVSGQKEDLYVESVMGTAIWMGKEFESVGDVPCGNTVALVGLHKFIAKSATITSDDEVDANTIRAMKFLTFPLVRADVHCEILSNLPKLKKCLKYLEKTDHMVICTNNEGSDLCVIAGAGELHLRISLKELQDYMDKVKITVSPFSAVLREGVVGKCSRPVMCTFANNRNRIYMKARPLEEEFLQAIDDGRIDPCGPSEVYSRILSEELGWDINVVNNIWCFGPETTGSNMVVDLCERKEVSNQIKDFVVAGFQLASKKGVLAEENIHGICLEVCDVVLNEDATRRGTSDQIITAVRRASHAAQLAAKPRLLQPVYLVEIKAHKNVIDATKAAVYSNKGNVFEKTELCASDPDNPLYNIKAYLAVQDSFEFSSKLNKATSGQAILLQFVFDHWEIVNSDPLKAGSLVACDVAVVRKSKGLSLQIPTILSLEDKL